MKVGILGGGQLGRMLALAAHPLGLRPHIYAPQRDCPAAVAAPVTCGAFDDVAAMTAFAQSVEVLTYEFEHLDVPTLQALPEGICLRPALPALAAAQDRVAEKTLLRQHGVATADFVAVDDEAGLQQAIRRLGLPLLLKTRRMGYDGKGQAWVRSAAEAPRRRAELGPGLIAEAAVPFTRELSLISVRGADGAVRHYPMAENLHQDGVLVQSRAPAPRLDTALRRKAHAAAEALLTALDYVGVLTIEFFDADGVLIANEIAPRVHNSGHWSETGAHTSQFENHLRAIAGLPLGDPAARGASLMLNLLGDVPDAAALLAVDGARLHLYGKTPRPGRKLGHLNLHAADHTACERLRAALDAGRDDRF
ncbi:MAG: 5-(carboxyamino)imidazole ribonucleotide synthase [Polyangiales bacterium]